MTNLERIKKNQSMIYLFFATILIIPFQVWILGSALIGSYNPAINNFVLTSQTYPYLAGYFTLTIIYCTIMSLLFHPKQIVSPVNIQIGTSFIVSLFLIYNQLATFGTFPIEQQTNFLLGLILILFFACSLLIMAGFIQFIIVRWVIGLNFDSVERVSFTVNKNPKKVLEILGDGFLDVWEFSRKKDNPKAKTNPIWILKCHDLYGNSIVLTIGTPTGKTEESILAFVAYHRSAYAISKSESASNMQKSIINDIKERLTQFDSNSEVKPSDKTDDPISIRAYNHALTVTRSKTEDIREFLKRTPRYYLYAIAVTIAIILVSTGAYGFGFLEVGTYISIAVGAAIALLFELGVSLREELSHQEIEELD